MVPMSEYEEATAEADNPWTTLVGRTVRRLLVGDTLEDAESMLVFETDRGDRVLVTDADCCSVTWFADILGVDRLLGHTVRGAIVVDMPETPEDGRTRQEYDQQYGARLTTDAGYVDIVYRNSSNGFYGGGCSLADGKARTRAENLREITADWHA
jgi:hypothetical protein